MAHTFNTARAEQLAAGLAPAATRSGLSHDDERRLTHAVEALRCVSELLCPETGNGSRCLRADRLSYLLDLIVDRFDEIEARPEDAA